MAARGDDGVQSVVAEQMRHKLERLEDFFKRGVADAQAAGVGAEGRHYGALTVTGKAAPLHRATAPRYPRFRMQMTGDFARSPGRLVTKRDRANRHFACDHAAEIARQCRVMIAGNPDPVAPRLQACNGVAVRRRQAATAVALVKTASARN